MKQAGRDGVLRHPRRTAEKFRAFAPQFCQPNPDKDAAERHPARYFNYTPQFESVVLMALTICTSRGCDFSNPSTDDDKPLSDS